MSNDVDGQRARDLEYAEFSLTYTEESLDYRILAWTAGFSLDVDESVDPVEIFTMDGFEFLYPEADDAPLWDRLDTVDQDTANFAPLASLSGSWLSDAAEALLEGFGSSLVIVSRVTLIPEWRGRGGAGRYLSARALDHVSRSASLMALSPYPIELPEDASQLDVKRGVKAIARLWGTLGFVPFPASPDIMVLPGGLVTLRDAQKQFLASIVDRAEQTAP